MGEKQMGEKWEKNKREVNRDSFSPTS